MINHPRPLLDAADDGRSELRASDSEREQAANLLRDHCAEGRLSPTELTDRLDIVYRAVTIGDLSAPMEDLPSATSTIARPRRELGARLPRQLAFPLAAAALVTVAAATDAHALWLAWPVLAIAGRHPRLRPSRRFPAAGGPSAGFGALGGRAASARRA